jgi:dimethylamine monooxygenase subunit A
MSPDWSRLFPAGEFRWHLGLRPGDARAFFAPTTDHASILAERAHWLSESPEEYALLTSRGEPLLTEAVEFARNWGAMFEGDSLLALGRAWEPDFVLLSLDEDAPVVEGGAVCFPTSWSLREKLGRTLMETHGPVPRLNAELATRISTALRKLAPGAAWERDNWGLVRTAELNRHPRMQRPRLEATETPGQVWLRTEHQLLFKLPRTGGILFGIRVGHLPLRELLADPIARDALRGALESMPDDAADYKGLQAVRPILIDWLRKSA